VKNHAGDCTLNETLQVKGMIHVSWDDFPFDYHEIVFDVSIDPPLTFMLPLPSPRETKVVSLGKWLLQRIDEGSDFMKLQLVSNMEMDIATRAEVMRCSFFVNRNIRYFLIRIFTPSVILVMASWSGFFIKPTVLMPRFASGFISFLALQSFTSLARSEMPRGLTKICVLDIYMTSLGYLMGFALLETVCAQYLFENFSQSLSRDLDRRSRTLFPSCLIFLAIGSLFVESVPNLLIFVHVVLFGFLMITILATLVEILFFPQVLLNRSIHMNRKYKKRINHPAVKSKPYVTLTDRELIFIFCAMDCNGNGSITVGEVEQWLFAKVRPRLSSDEQTLLKQHLDSHFGEEEINETNFGKSFNFLIKMIVGVNPKHMKYGKKQSEAQERDEEEDIQGSIGDPRSGNCAAPANPAASTASAAARQRSVYSLHVACAPQTFI